jgi:hypothetical protein
MNLYRYVVFMATPEQRQNDPLDRTQDSARHFHLILDIISKFITISYIFCLDL